MDGRFVPCWFVLFGLVGCGAPGPDTQLSDGQTFTAHVPGLTEGERTETSQTPVTNSIGMRLIPIPAGEFQMGSPASDLGGVDGEGIDREKPRHRVTITLPFYLGATEVTQAQYQRVMDARPWQGQQYTRESPDDPATFVSWNDAVAFCHRLSELPQERAAGNVYGLPTEAQWEYACRAGTTTIYSFGHDVSQLAQHAWYRVNAEDVDQKYPHRVGQKQPNPWGLFDMHGNVWEWCQDRYAIYPAGPVADPLGPSSGSRRVHRGGSWDGRPGNCRSTRRGRPSPDDRYSDYGFRVACRRASPSPAKTVESNRSDKTSRAAALFDEPTGKQTLADKPRPQENPIVNSIDMRLVPIPAGAFQMGSADLDRDAADREKPRHSVTITKPYYLGATEVTQSQYLRVMGAGPWQGQGFVREKADHPAVYVQWHDAVEFCRKLTELPEEKAAGNAYRLPTEAEWEYACRAGTTTIYNFGDDAFLLQKHAWYYDNVLGVGQEYACRVGQKHPNGWGLYDMHGNVWEWCRDSDAPYPAAAVTDPQGPSSRSDQIRRGGSWRVDAQDCRSADRHRYAADYRSDYRDYGFRVLCRKSSE